METFSVFIILSLILSATTAQKRFRSDYEYNKSTDAFYKLHIEARKVWQASAACDAEGAHLMLPSSSQDLKQIHAMLKRFPDIGEFVWVASDGQNHESAEETPIIDLQPRESEEQEWNRCDVVARGGDIETADCFQNRPFMCKIEAKDIYYNRRCDVYGKGYQYFPNVGSCYKVPDVSGTWSQGFEECRAEGAHLVVINSQEEMTVVQNMLKTVRHVRGAKVSWFFFAGFRAEKEKAGEPRVFKTVLNQTLDEAGFNQWSENEPNNHLNSEYCGSIFRSDGKFNDLDCSHPHAFVCESEVHTTS